MRPFKEPQPRKTQPPMPAPAPRPEWPPYSRLGNEARWPTVSGEKEAGKLPEPENIDGDTRTSDIPGVSDAPPDLIPDSDLFSFEARKAALEAACALNPADFTTFWQNIEALEEYLRDGTKP